MKKGKNVFTLIILSLFLCFIILLAFSGCQKSENRDAEKTRSAAEKEVADKAEAKIEAPQKVSYQSKYAGPRNPVKKWEFKTDGFESMAVTASDETIYFGSDDGILYAANYEGKLRWKFTAESSIESLALYSDGEVCVITMDGKLYLVDSAGRQKWVFGGGGSAYSPPLIVEHGIIYFGTSDGNFYAVDGKGAKIWVFNGSGSMFKGATIGTDGKIYTSDSDGNLFALDKNGRKIWEKKFSAWCVPLAGKDGRLYVGEWGYTDSGDYFGKIHAFKADGEKVWELKTDLGISSLIQADDGTIYAAATVEEEMGDTFGKLYAITPEGKLKWVYDAGEGIDTGLAIDKNGIIYLTTSSGKMLAISPQGKKVWEFYEKDYRFCTDPVIASECTIYAGCAFAGDPGLTEERGYYVKLVSIGEK